ncbi:hypothetical protein HMI55_000028 [Coelomomyces lativittatus]|nr:hypothetical protein HMI55_000028 [Coelomomyces lativittatus]KAJ1514127.1 hypothetical protein HMI56_001121 [Coelomomyces lativittatus]
MAIQSAFNRLSSVLDIRVPIKAYFLFDDLCAGSPDSKCSTVGTASPKSFPVQITSTDFLISSSDNIKLGLNPGAVYYLPQSLIKQSNIPDLGLLSSYDIRSTFNSKTNWWFKEDNVPINQNQLDLELVVLHESLHGLGFGSTSFTFSKKWTNLLLPVYDTMNTVKGNFQFNYPTLWDAFLKVHPSGKMTKPISWLNNYELYNEAERGKVTPKTTEAEFVDIIFKNSTAVQDASWRFQVATTPNTIEFVPIQDRAVPRDFPNPQSTLYLETSLKSYEPGSSMSHLSSSAGLTSGEFLMFRSTSSISLSQVPGFASTYLNSGIGPGILLCLQTLGYKIRGSNDTHVLEGQLVSSDMGISGSHFLKPEFYLFYMSFLSLFFTNF